MDHWKKLGVKCWWNWPLELEGCSCQKWIKVVVAEAPFLQMLVVVAVVAVVVVADVVDVDVAVDVKGIEIVVVVVEALFKQIFIAVVIAQVHLKSV